ncbi:MAG: WG repeat-containing protein [Bacteroidales bacterium]|nr:WG repeat-containing protein [Bacteroidales bacterium]
MSSIKIAFQEAINFFNNGDYESAFVIIEHNSEDLEKPLPDDLFEFFKRIVICRIEKNRADDYFSKGFHEDATLHYESVLDYDEENKHIQQQLLISKEKSLYSQQLNELHGFVDYHGNTVISYQFQYVFKFNEGYANVINNDKYGLINRTGEIIIPAIYDFVYPRFESELLLVQKNKKCGFFNNKREMMIDFKYDCAKPFTKEGLTEVLINKKWGIINKEDKLIVSFIYDAVSPSGFSEKLCGVRYKGKWGYIDTEGKTVIDFIFNDAGSFINDMAPVKLKNKWGYINKHGDVVIDFIYTEAAEYKWWFAVVKQGKTQFLINRKGQIIHDIKRYNEWII